MPENKFEHDMQEQMEELKFRPSAAVWEKVEGELRRKKRRRIVFYVSLVTGLCLLTAGGLFFLTSGSKEKQDSSIIAGHEAEIKIQNEKNQILVEQTSLDTNNNHKTPAVTTNQAGGDTSTQSIGSSATKQNLDNNNPDIVTHHISEKFERSKKRPDPGTKSLNNNKPSTISNGKSLRIDEAVPIASDRPVKKNIVSVGTGISTTDKNKNPITASDALATNRNHSQVLKGSSDTLAAHIDSSTAINENHTEPISNAITTARKSKRKLTWLIDGGVGFSNRKDQAFIKMPATSKAERDPFSGNLGIPNPPQINSPSAVKSGPSFKIGVAAALQITKKSSISAGLQYSYFSDKIRTAAYRDTNLVVSNSVSNAIQVRALYDVVGEKDYTNRYHFVQLPLGYHVELGKGPISWNLLAVPGYLITSNALIYDTVAGGAYYKDKHAIPKFHFNLGTGLSVRIGNERRVHLAVGPEVSFDMTRLVRNVYDAKQYLWYGGINLKLKFPTGN